LPSWDAIRRILFAEFAEAAILGYLKSPRSSLIGHPAFDTTTYEQDANATPNADSPRPSQS